MKALALFSGGLDSTLAIRLIQKQNIEVIALNFVSHFFGGASEKTEKMEEIASNLGVKLEYIEFQNEQLEVVKNPKFGYGKNMNPCIDCHGLMLKIAGNLLKKYGASFIITGEVLGERPKSQNYKALQQVEQLSEVEGLVVRPLSARCLPETLPEKNGWLDRSQLLDIQGRGRKPQIALAATLSITDYPNPGGGCLLTDISYSNRLRVLKNEKMMDRPELFTLIRMGRMLHLGKQKFILVGRNAETNAILEQSTDKADHFLIADVDYPGPTILGFGNLNEEDLQFTKDVFARYSKLKGKSEQPVELDGKQVIARAIDPGEIQKKITTCNIV